MLSGSFVTTTIWWLVGSAAVGCLIEVVLGLGRTWLASRHGEEALQRAEVLTRDGKIEDAVRIARGLPGPVSEVLVAGLSAPDEESAERAMAEAAAAQRKRLAEPVRTLDVLGVTAVALPLLGAAIRVLLGDGANQTEEWQRTLFVLAVGLGTAIFATLGRFWILARIRRIVVEMEKGAAVVYNTAR